VNDDVGRDQVTKVQKGNRAEFRVYEKLIQLGFRDVRMNRGRAPYDLEVDGYPVEVKYSTPRGGPSWTFGIRSKGDPIVPVIAYVLCVDGAPGEKGWVFMVLPGPISQNQYRVSLEGIRGDKKRLIDNWAALQPIPYPLVPRRLPKRLHKGVDMTVFGHGGNIPASIEGYIHYHGLNLSRFSRIIGFSAREVQNVIDGTIPPSSDLMYSLGARMG
jgi:hypothetical protein